MGLLATWGQYSTYTDAEGRYRVFWQLADGTVTQWKFDSQPAQIVMERHFGKMESGIERLVYFDDEDELTLRDAIAYIRVRPSLTLNQWNAYLNTLTYEKRAIIKAFIHKLAIKLAQHYGLVLDNYTETEILAKVRNWICTADLSLLKRVCFGYLITL